MKELVLSYPDDLDQAVRLTGEELSAQLRLMAALKMFELGKLSSGKAAELAGLSRGEFFEACGRYRVSIYNYPDEEIEAELRADLRAAGGSAEHLTVVSNTGPIVALAKADHLWLLQILYGEVLIPPAVHRELLAKVGPEAQRIDDGLAGFLRVSPIARTREEVDRLTSGLGAGEQQAIALVLEAGGLLLMDDRAGRKAAAQLGIATTGAVGVLLKAKQEGHLPMVGPVLEIIRRDGYWLSDAVVEGAMRLAGESSGPR